MTDVGLTHVALAVRDLSKSIAFYERFANMKAVHEREGVAWISDRTRLFVIVLVEVNNEKEFGAPLGPFSHLGVACETREEVDRLVALARKESCLEREPIDSGEPVGYWAFIRDPDGHILELSFGQEVGEIVSGT